MRFFCNFAPQIMTNDTLIVFNRLALLGIINNFIKYIIKNSNHET